jgi:DNA-binding transcriptional LysR family regulator
MRGMDEQLWFITGLHAFVRVEGLHSLDEAHKRNGLPARTTVGDHLKQFNDALGTDVTLTGVKRSEAGKRIEKDAKELLLDLEQRIRWAHEHLKRLARADRPVSIAMSPTVWMWGTGPGRLPLTNSLPGHSAEFLVANSARVEKVVSDGLFEIGITAGAEVRASRDASFNVEPFADDEIVVLVPPDHEWSRRRHLKAQDLASTQLIALDITANARQVVDAAMREAELQLAEPLEEAATAGLVLEEALRAKAPALVPELALGAAQGAEAEEAGFVRKRVKDIDLSRSFALIYQEPKMLRPEAQKTLDDLREMQPLN